MKKLYKALILIVMAISFTLIFSNVKLNADTGPKSYVEIEIVGETQGYYMTLLASSEGWGPYSSNPDHHEDIDEIDLKFKAYSDNDEFYYWFEYWSIEDKEMTWGYYPPDTFKILIYDSINDRFITDNKVYERTSFSTVLKLTLKDGNSEVPFSVTKKANYLMMVVLGFLLRLTICIAIELGIAFLFKFKKKQYLVVIYTNVATQVLLNLCLALLIYFLGFQVYLVYPAYIVIEFLIIFIEWLIYALTLNKVNKENIIPIYKSCLYSLSANVASFVLGFIILYLLGF